MKLHKKSYRNSFNPSLFLAPSKIKYANTPASQGGPRGRVIRGSYHSTFFFLIWLWCNLKVLLFFGVGLFSLKADGSSTVHVVHVHFMTCFWFTLKNCKKKSRECTFYGISYNHLWPKMFFFHTSCFWLLQVARERRINIEWFTVIIND